jgi:single-stranded-DNA-specific exonuclease
MRQFTMISEAVDLIQNSKKLIIYSHHDSDGIASAGIALFVIKRLGLNYEIRIRNQLTIEDITGKDGEIYWFNDMGSSKVNDMKNIKGIITDHHNPAIMDNFIQDNGNEIYQFNPHLEGLDGSISQSGSTTTFLFSMNIIQEVIAVSHLSVIGSVGDLHDKKYGRLVETDREVMNLSKEVGIIEPKNDIRYFGRSSKPVSYMLRFGNDPKINSLYDKPDAVYMFLEKMGIPRKMANSTRWVDISEEKRKSIINELLYLLEKEGGEKNRLIGEVYELKTEPISSVLKDARDFSSIINATSRKGNPEVGVKLCLFERGPVLEEAMRLYSDHTETLRKASKFLDEMEGKVMGIIHYYDFGSNLENNITGTIATRIITHKKIPKESVVIVMANIEGSKKISGRISLDLSEKLDLSLIFRDAAELVGGSGGGHRNAAGAMIPDGKEYDFIKNVNKIIEGIIKPSQ